MQSFLAQTHFINCEVFILIFYYQFLFFNDGPNQVALNSLKTVSCFNVCAIFYPVTALGYWNRNNYSNRDRLSRLSIVFLLVAFSTDLFYTFWNLYV